MAMLRRHWTQHGQLTGAFGPPVSSSALTDSRAGETADMLFGLAIECSHPNQQACDLLPPTHKPSAKVRISLSGFGGELCLDQIEPALGLDDGPRIELAGGARRKEEGAP